MDFRDAFLFSDLSGHTLRCRGGCGGAWVVCISSGTQGPDHARHVLCHSGKVLIEVCALFVVATWAHQGWLSLTKASCGCSACQELLWCLCACFRYHASWPGT